MTGETTTVIKFVKLSNVVMLKFNGIDSTNVTTPTRMTAFTRVNFVFDIIASTTPSSILMEEEIAAKNKLKKNTIAIIVPPGILSKMIGIVINRSGGPALTSKPNANTAGMITNDASTAANVSSTSVLIASLGIL